MKLLRRFMQTYWFLLIALAAPVAFAAFTRTWNAAYEISPADADNVSEGASKIRNLKVDIRERMAKDHYMDIAGTDADHGEHVKATLREQSAKPTAEANKGYLYTKDVAGVTELYYEDNAGKETVITSDGSLTLATTIQSTTANKVTVSSGAVTVKVSSANQAKFTDGTIEPITDDDVDLGASDKQFKRLYLERGITINAINQGEDTVTAVNRKTVDIGAWDMDSTSSLNVAHGVTATKILHIAVAVFSDSGEYYPLDFGGVPNGAYFSPAGYFYADGTNVKLYRAGGGTFDQTTFDSTAATRGTITIWYTN